MKVYKFYKNPTDNELLSANVDDLTIQDKYPLYAFTDNKEIRERFISERNMDRFIEIITKMSKEEYVDFANRNNGERLDVYSYEHNNKYVSKKSGKLKYSETYEMIDAKVISTWSEREWVNSIADDGISDLTDYISYHFFPFILKKKYIKALAILEFLSYWKLLGPVQMYEEYARDDELGDLDYSPPSTQIDQLNLLLHLFGDTFK